MTAADMIKAILSIKLAGTNPHEFTDEHIDNALALVGKVVRGGLFDDKELGTIVVHDLLMVEETPKAEQMARAERISKEFLSRIASDK